MLLDRVHPKKPICVNVILTDTLNTVTVNSVVIPKNQRLSTCKEEIT